MVLCDSRKSARAPCDRRPGRRLHERCGIEVKDMARSRRVYTKLRAFRAGIEGTLSLLKRTFGLERCTWRGFPSLSADVHCSVLECTHPGDGSPSLGRVRCPRAQRTGAFVVWGADNSLAGGTPLTVSASVVWGANEPRAAAQRFWSLWHARWPNGRPPAAAAFSAAPDVFRRDLALLRTFCEIEGNADESSFELIAERCAAGTDRRK